MIRFGSCQAGGGGTPDYASPSARPRGGVAGHAPGRPRLSRTSAHPTRPQSRAEEIANSLSHGLGFLAALVALPVLVLASQQRGAAAVVGAAVFGTTMALLYLTSTLYHAVTPARAKQVLRILDHGAIYLLIAGTYTPFTLGVLRGPWGWTLFGIVWSLALAGILLKSVWG